MKVVILGCNGLLGQNLVGSLPEDGIQLGGMGLESETALDLEMGYRQVDISVKEGLQDALKKVNPDWIINAAALTDVDGCEVKRDLCRRINCEAVAWMAELGKPMVHISSDYVFDGMDGPYREEDRPNPLSFYGLTKLQSEREVLGRNASSLVLRTMLLWGKGQGLKKSFVEFVRESLESGKRIRIVTDQVGNPTLAQDLAESIWALIGKRANGVFHVCGEERLSRMDWAKAIATHYGLDSDLLDPCTSAELAQSAPRPMSSGFHLDKLRGILGWVPGGVSAQLGRF